MRVLVTGHRGYIGCVMTQVLGRAGHEVVGLDSDLYRACTFGPALPDVQSLEEDLRDAPLHLLSSIDAVVHLAALSNDPLGELDPNLTHDINHRASIRLASMAREAGVQRFVFASSCSVYGSSNDEILTEHSARAPLTPYALSKALVEDGLIALADESFSPTIMRNATAYGVSPRLRLDIVLNDLVAQAVATGTIRLNSKGLAWRPMVHVQDICQAVQVALDAPREVVHGQVFNVGSTRENYRVIDMVERIRQALPVANLEIKDGATADARDYYVGCDWIQRRLPAFKPRWTLARGIDELVQAYRALDLGTGSFSRYFRLAEIRRRLASGEMGRDLRWTAAAAPASATAGAPAPAASVGTS
jgi:nucleoside-diphosphate-sugar epimerase